MFECFAKFALCIFIMLASYVPSFAVSAAQPSCNRLLVEHTDIWSADISPDGAKLVLAYTNSPNALPIIDVFDLASGKRVFTNIGFLITASGGISSVRWEKNSTTPRLLVLKTTLDSSGSISVVDLDQKKVVSSYRCPKCLAFDISKSGQMGVIQRVNPREYILRIKDRFPSGMNFANIKNPTMIVDEFSLSPNSEYAVYPIRIKAENSNKLSFAQLVYDVSTSHTYTLPLNFLRTTWFSNDEVIVLGLNDLTVYIENVVTGERHKFADVKLDSKYNVVEGVMADPLFRYLLVLAKGESTGTDLYIVSRQCQQ